MCLVIKFNTQEVVLFLKMCVAVKMYICQSFVFILITNW